MEDKYPAITLLVKEKTGWNLSETVVENIQRVVGNRIRDGGFASSREYQLFLTRENKASREEWEIILDALSTKETYFFRDNAHIQLLKSRILPALIKAREQIKTIRVWSAGCSTGEEPYSLAILLWELIGRNRDWDIRIIGTDISRQALDKASSATYSEWSFRGMDKGLRARYFKQDKGWTLEPCISSLVRFHLLNLTEDTVPDPLKDIQGFDLIICRNVFIYFSSDTIAKVLKKFHSVLTDDGYLLTGHAEVLGVELSDFNLVAFPEAHVLQKTEAKASESRRTDLVVKPNQSVVRFQQNDGVQKNVKISTKEIKSQPSKKKKAVNFCSDNDLLSRARYLADAKQYDEALSKCQQAVGIDPLNPLGYYLMGLIYIDNGNIGLAKEQLEKTVFLSPNFVSAYIQLGHIYQLQGKREKAQKLWETAGRILGNAPEDMEYDGDKGPEQAGLLLKYVNQLLGEGR